VLDLERKLAAAGPRARDVEVLGAVLALDGRADALDVTEGALLQAGEGATSQGITERGGGDRE